MRTLPPQQYVTFVCTGNTCRSPMAAALLSHALKAEKEPLRSLAVVSAGLSVLGGEPASPNAVLALGKVSIPLGGHRSRQLTQEMLDGSLAVFAMTQSHLATLRACYRPFPAAPLLMRALMARPCNLELLDPYGQGVSVYEACRDNMVEAIPSIIAHLRGLV
ncbi:MAG: low molecular weight protein arginine phosphatase [Puniceicoccales bacterium]|jgi:protein-tyrosine-phosphatase|nr:low molecular weight protein arginine phosphatase [Puniceicoccales bacterium]